MITSRQIREARALLGWTTSQLARASFLKLDAIDHAEKGAEEGFLGSGQQLAIRRAFERAGVEFTSDPPGVRMRKERPTLISEDGGQL